MKELLKRKIVIAGSAKLQDKINHWISYFDKQNYKILDYPKTIEKEKFMNLYPDIHKNFFQNITQTDILFIMNEDKNNISGYIGAETFNELGFGLAQKLIYNKNIELIILKMPDKTVQCYEEINLWLKLGWIKIYKIEEE